jgi:hypothetical protein
MPVSNLEVNLSESTAMLTESQQKATREFVAKSMSVKHDSHGHRVTSFNLFLLGKKVYQVMDDGWGGDVDYKPCIPNAEITLMEWAKKNNLLDAVCKYGVCWGNAKTGAEVKPCDVLTTLGDLAFNVAQNVKADNKVKRDMLNGFLCGSANEYFSIGWKKHSLQDVYNAKGGVKMLQDTYNKIILDEGADQIMNSKEQLISLGIKL